MSERQSKLEGFHMRYCCINCVGISITSVDSLTMRDEYRKLQMNDMVEFMFQHRLSQGDQKSQALAGIIFCSSNRGYWNVPLIMALDLWSICLRHTYEAMVDPIHVQPDKVLNRREKIKIEFGRSCFGAYVHILFWSMKVLA